MCDEKLPMNLAGMRSCAGANSCWWPLDLLSSVVRLLRAFALCRRAVAHICPPAECPKRLTCTFNLTSAISVFVNHMFNMLGGFTRISYMSSPHSAQRLPDGVCSHCATAKLM